MRQDQFYSEAPPSDDPWGTPVVRLDLELIGRLEKGPLAGDDDLRSALSLTRLVHEEYQAFGTDGHQSINVEESRNVLTSLRRVLARRGVTLEVPWRDFESFRTHWIREGCSGTGGWQARRELLDTYFLTIEDTLERAQDEEFRAELVEAVSPHGTTGWQRVDEEIAALRQRFRTAATAQDYRDVGNRSVAVLEAISATVFDPSKHLKPEEQVPAVDKSNIRIGAFIDKCLPGNANEEVRGLAKKASTMAHHVKHSPSGSRRDSGIIADAVILLANMLRRLDDSAP